MSSFKCSSSIIEPYFEIFDIPPSPLTAKHTDQAKHITNCQNAITSVQKADGLYPRVYAVRRRLRSQKVQQLHAHGDGKQSEARFLRRTAQPNSRDVHIALQATRYKRLQQRLLAKLLCVHIGNLAPWTDQSKKTNGMIQVQSKTAAKELWGRLFSRLAWPFDGLYAPKNVLQNESLSNKWYGNFGVWVLQRFR